MCMSYDTEHLHQSCLLTAHSVLLLLLLRTCMVLLCNKLAIGIPPPGHNTLLQRQCSRRGKGLSVAIFHQGADAPHYLHSIAGVSCGPALLCAGRAQEQVAVPTNCCPHLLPHAACNGHRLHASAPITDGLLCLTYLQVCGCSSRTRMFAQSARRRASAGAEHCKRG